MSEINYCVNVSRQVPSTFGEGTSLESLETEKLVKIFIS